jgi:hypothetical protein
MSTWFITECTVTNRGTKSASATQFRISCAEGFVFADDNQPSHVYTKPEAVSFVEARLAAGDDVFSWHVVGGKTYTQRVGVRTGKIASPSQPAPKWLETYADGVWNDNLYSLPDVA